MAGQGHVFVNKESAYVEQGAPWFARIHDAYPIPAVLDGDPVIGHWPTWQEAQDAAHDFAREHVNAS